MPPQIRLSNGFFSDTSVHLLHRGTYILLGNLSCVVDTCRHGQKPGDRKYSWNAWEWSRMISHFNLLYACVHLHENLFESTWSPGQSASRLYRIHVHQALCFHVTPNYQRSRMMCISPAHITGLSCFLCALGSPEVYLESPHRACGTRVSSLAQRQATRRHTRTCILQRGDTLPFVTSTYLIELKEDYFLLLQEASPALGALRAREGPSALQ